MSRLVRPLFLNSSSHVATMQLHCLYSENQPFPWSNSSLAPCCHLMDKAKKKKGWSHRAVVCLAEKILHRQRPRNRYCIFCLFVRLWCMVLFKHPPAHLQLSRCQGVECPCLSLEWERKNDTDREQQSICDCFPVHPPHPDLGCCNSDWRRKEEGQVPLIGDQWWSVSAWIRDQEQWVGPAPPLPHTNPGVPLPPILAQIRAAGPANRGGPPWLSTVRGWCSSGTDAGRLRERMEGGLLGQSRHGPWSLEDGPERKEENSSSGILFCA